MSHKITVADAMWETAESVIAMGKKIGIHLNIVDVYNKDDMKELALIANFLIQQVKKGGNIDVEIVR